MTTKEQLDTLAFRQKAYPEDYYKVTCKCTNCLTTHEDYMILLGVLVSHAMCPTCGNHTMESVAAPLMISNAKVNYISDGSLVDNNGLVIREYYP